MSRQKISAKNGFTLIELIIVIAILSILSFIAIPRYTEYKRTAEINADKATCKTIYDTIMILKSENKVINNTTIGNLIQGGWPIPQSPNGNEFKYTLSPISVYTDTPGVQHPSS